MNYTPLEFKSYWAEVVKFQSLTDPLIQRTIDYVWAAWDDFQCYSPDLQPLLYHLAVAHTLEDSGHCQDASSPWFSPSVTEVKSYNDTLKFAAPGSDLDSTLYGRQLRILLEKRTTPVLYFDGLGC